jgi:hypothetical protein
LLLPWLGSTFAKDFTRCEPLPPVFLKVTWVPAAHWATFPRGNHYRKMEICATIIEICATLSHSCCADDSTTLQATASMRSLHEIVISGVRIIG